MDYPAIVIDNKLPVYGNRRVSFLAPGNSETIKCAFCKQIIRYGGNDTNIVAAFCTSEHFNQGNMNFLPECSDLIEHPITEHTSNKSASNKPKKCQTKEPRTCPHCQGPPRGRGFIHQENCATKSNKKKKLRRKPKMNKLRMN